MADLGGDDEGIGLEGVEAEAAEGEGEVALWGVWVVGLVCVFGDYGIG